MKTYLPLISFLIFSICASVAYADVIWSSSFESSPDEDWFDTYIQGTGSTLTYVAAAASTGNRGADHYVPSAAEDNSVARGRAYNGVLYSERHVRCSVSVDGFNLPETYPMRESTPVVRDAGSLTEVYFRRDGNDYQFRLRIRTPSGYEDSDPVVIDKAEWHTLDLYLKDETSPGVGDGIIRWWVDGTEEYTRTDLTEVGESDSWVFGVAGPAGGLTNKYGHVYVDDVWVWDSLNSPVKRTLDVSSTAGGEVTGPGEGTFEYSEGEIVNLVASSDSGYEFVVWTGTGVVAGKVADPGSSTTTIAMDSDYTVEAVFGIFQPDLSVSSTAGGLVTDPGEGNFEYTLDQVVTITAEADADYHFVEWTGTGVDAGKVVDPGSESTTITMSGNYTLEAVFAADMPTLTVSSTEGGSVTDPGEGDFDYTLGAIVTITAAADPNYHFVEWTGTGVDAGKVADPNAATTTITMDADYAVEAQFEIDQHTLTVSSTAGGAVTDPGEGAFDYDYNTLVTIVASADPNYHFVGWTGTAVIAGKVTDPGSESTSVTVDADYTVEAQFEIDQHTLTVSSTVGGSVTDPGEGAYDYDYNTLVTIVAAADPNYHFVGWTGTAVIAGKVTDPGSESTSVTVDADYTVEAQFEIDQHTLTVSSTAGGSVTDPGEGAFDYDYNTLVTIVATGDPNYHFVGWTGIAVVAGKVTDPGSESTSVMVDADYTVEAQFEIDQHTLTVSSTAGGSVTDPGEGPYDYDHDTQVTIVAVADAEYKFVEWTGTGVDAGKVADPNGDSTSITMDSDYAVIANFVLIDSDGDGLPDDWEQQIIDDDPNDDIETIEDVLPGDDYDGDGNSNETELAAGTDPTDPASFFAIVDVQRSLLPLEITITWTSVAGKYYAIYYSDDEPSSGMTWTMAQDMIPASGTGTNEWTDDGSLTTPVPDDENLPRRLYRVLVYPE